MNSIEEHQNLISLLKKALSFYADVGNYTGAMGTIAPIDLDEYGSQARFALEQTKKIEEANEKIQNDYNKIINETIEAIENHPFDLTDALTKFKNIEDEDNHV